MTSWCSLITAALIAVLGFAVAQVFPGHGIWIVLLIVFPWIAHTRRKHRLSKQRRADIVAPLR